MVSQLAATLHYPKSYAGRSFSALRLHPHYTNIKEDEKRQEIGAPKTEKSGSPTSERTYGREK